MLFSPGSQLGQVLGGRLIPLDFQAHLRAGQPCLLPELIFSMDLQGRTETFRRCQERRPDRYIPPREHGDLVTFQSKSGSFRAIFPAPSAIFLADKIPVTFFGRVNLAPAAMDLRGICGLRPARADAACLPRRGGLFAQLGDQLGVTVGIKGGILGDPLPLIGFPKAGTGKRVSTSQSKRDAPHLAGFAVGDDLYPVPVASGHERGKIRAVFPGGRDFRL